MRRWLVLLAVLTGCADATTGPAQMQLDADAGVDTGTAVPDARPLICPPGDRGENCISTSGKRTFKGDYACALPNGRLEIGCTYADDPNVTLIVASCAECQ